MHHILCEKSCREYKEDDYKTCPFYGDWYYENVGDKKELTCQIGLASTEYDVCVKCPTLSELIEACGIKFDRLDRDKSIWEVRGGVNYCDIKTEAKTPEEAVAKLWLALNQK